MKAQTWPRPPPQPPPQKKTGALGFCVFAFLRFCVFAFLRFCFGAQRTSTPPLGLRPSSHLRLTRMARPSVSKEIMCRPEGDTAMH